MHLDNGDTHWPRIHSISGVQEKYSLILDKNKLRLLNEGEQGNYILKPIPQFGEKQDQIPANEHLTMQIARQIYKIETAENALIFFQSGKAAYLTKRFDINSKGEKLSIEDFASLAGRTPQTHGENYKYLGSYLELFELLEKYLNTYKIEALKLFKLLLFNYLFSNGDAHFKNFSVLETVDGDYKLSPAYDLLNTRIHVADSYFALEKGLLPTHLAIGNVRKQFYVLAEKAKLKSRILEQIFSDMLSHSDKVNTLIQASFLDEPTKRQYLQAYQTRYKRLTKE
ncbi:MAG: HipA domain-containing protein [Bacteroidota bacterium]